MCCPEGKETRNRILPSFPLRLPPRKRGRECRAAIIPSEVWTPAFAGVTKNERLRGETAPYRIARKLSMQATSALRVPVSITEWPASGMTS